MNRLTLALALILTATPALAGDRPLTLRERDERIGGCILTYGPQYRDRCVEIMEGPGAIGRRARQGYEWWRWSDEIDRERECWDDPATVNPMVCFEGPVRSR